MQVVDELLGRSAQQQHTVEDIFLLKEVPLQVKVDFIILLWNIYVQDIFVHIHIQ